MTRDEFIRWAVTTQGYEVDRYGHLQKTLPAGTFEVKGTTVVRETEKTYRYKLSKVMARLEVKIPARDKGTIFESEASWQRIRSGYFAKMSINEHGQLRGMQR